MFTVFNKPPPHMAKPSRFISLTGSKADRGYRNYSWNQWVTYSREIALGLRALGVQHGELVCVLSETRAEFYIVDLGIMGSRRNFGRPLHRLPEF